MNRAQAVRSDCYVLEEDKIASDSTHAAAFTLRIIPAPPRLSRVIVRRFHLKPQASVWLNRQSDEVQPPIELCPPFQLQRPALRTPARIDQLSMSNSLILEG